MELDEPKEDKKVDEHFVNQDMIKKIENIESQMVSSKGW